MAEQDPDRTLSCVSAPQLSELESSQTLHERIDH